jgi:hypothetical protein
VTQTEEECLFSWTGPLDRLTWRADGSGLLAVLGGTWDWQLWEIGFDAAPPRRLVGEAAGIFDVAPAPEGGRVAVVAAPEVAYGEERREIFVVDPEQGTQRIDLGLDDVEAAEWLDTDSLAVVVSDSRHPTWPRRTELKRLELVDGSLSRLWEQP